MPGYLSKRIPTSVALTIVFIFAILVGGLIYLQTLEIEKEEFESSEMKIIKKIEKVIFEIIIYGECSDIVDKSYELKEEECNKILSENVDLRRKGLKPEECRLVNIRDEDCTELRSRLVCSYNCEKIE